MRLRSRLAVLLLTCLAVGGTAATIMVVQSDALAWRARVVLAKLLGELPEIPLSDFVRWLAPASPVHMAELAKTRNVRAAIQNLLTDRQSAENGAHLFRKHCGQCHGDTGRGAAGPDLVVSVANSTDWAYFSAVKWGRVGTAMVAQPLSDLEIWETHAFVRELAVRAAGDHQLPVAGRALNVSAEAILASSERPHEWLTYAGNYAGHRHTALSQIAKSNVADLRVAWVAQLRSADVYLESSPIIAGGLLFATMSPGGVVALDARTGERVWQFLRPVPPDLPLCCGAPNRGAAILGDSVFVATLDAYLVAVDVATGRRKWQAKVADPGEGYSMTGAPLAVRDRVLVGVAGGGHGIRGFVAAFAADDGRLLWKFHTVPAPGEPGSESWAGDSWRHGGAPTWTTGAYEPALDLVYWGVGNPAPVHHSESRTGDNLFSNSIVALERTSGKLRWYFQFIPGGEHGWDAVQQPVLAGISWEGKRRDALLHANRNGVFYALDRQTGQFLFARPFVKQTWAAGFQPDGRPVLRPEAKPSRTGSLVWPGVAGGTNWWPPSYDRTRGVVYVPSVDAAGIFFAEKNVRFQRGVEFMGSSAQTTANQPVTAALKAIDANTGDIRWQAELARGGSEVLRVVGGVLSTSTGLVFAGYGEDFLAFDADDGKKLWQVRVGGRINAAPVSYAIGGRQFVAVMAGPSLFVFSLPPTK